VSAALVLLVRIYQRLVSPLLPRRCRYHPTCSAYAVEAIRLHGPARGVVLAGWRLLRCNPWSRGGVDHPSDARFLARRGGATEPASPTAGGEAA
jgi:uncharacterized protein